MSRRAPSAGPTRVRAPAVSGPSRPRPASTLLKSTASVRSIPESRDHTPQPPMPHAQAMEAMMSPGKGRERESGDNIQVVVRCRGRNQKEIDEQSPIIIGCPMSDASPPDPQEVTVETSHGGALALPGVLMGGSNANTRTYPFDRVFGPEVGQATIYDSVVEPLLREVLEGYNCSLLAYGQTGTGKTYTMQGDLSPSPLTGGPSTNAGMIPRALSALFAILNETTTDWSVKCSYIELYNEELRDLLAPELAAPMGTAQPMSKGKDQQGAGLKIFEDGAKKGCVIQGLEEVAIKDERDAMKLLLRGSRQRQVAATKFNDHSSRSHSVFTITVHSTSPAPSKLGVSSASDNELLRVGKLNLVDLAGSENIGRSGAADKRAREAGMINQSLLTLGRVINALVEGSSHVPYRESKLTRLLQDSLGGRTKTTLIATVSPAKANLEETLSTLDYALTAKAIRNRPEINQRMSKAQLIKEYNIELERLKADLLAAREKDGVWVSNETWEELSRESEVKRTAHVEATRRVMELDVQLKALQTEFKESLALLSKRDGELKDARSQIAQDEADLREKEAELSRLLVSLQEEIAVREAFQAGEARVHGVATELKSTVQESLGDVDGLFAKIDRKQKAIGHNRKTVVKHASRLEDEAQRMEGAVDEFATGHGEAVKVLREMVGGLQQRQAEALAEQNNFIDARLDALSNFITTIRTQEEHTNDASAAMEATVALDGEAVREDVKRCLRTLRDEVHAKNEQMSKLLDRSLLEVQSTVDQVFGILSGVAKQTASYAEEEKRSLSTTIEALLQVSTVREQRLQRQVTSLKTLLLRQQGEHHKELERQLAQYRQRCDAGLSNVLAEFGQEGVEAAAQDAKDVQSVNDKLSERIERAGVIVQTSDEWQRQGTKMRDETLRVVTSVSSTAASALSQVSTDVSDMVEKQQVTVDNRFKALNGAFLEAHRRVEESKNARIKATDALESNVRDTYRGLKRKREETWSVEEEDYGRIEVQTSSLDKLTDSFRGTHTSHMAGVRKHNKFMVENGTAEDRPTGETPQRKSWRYPQNWQLTSERDQVLADWRHRQETKDPESASDTAGSAVEVELVLAPDPTLQKSLSVPLPSPMAARPTEDYVVPIVTSKSSRSIPRASSRPPAGRENVPVNGHHGRPSKRLRQ
ncbi:kinesin-domain-containing protein [Calocera viscosa TUFC12733]|uniref:Kinesin-domain-containing protein n=1 Tax=Calocera viscosa (strain TUFC12733) TaxID=1330018 RepID=A0A167LZW2_CALVF|nr:kinesin-domain-containing protein [Calocera viscosa TUFC12733]